MSSSSSKLPSITFLLPFLLLNLETATISDFKIEENKLRKIFKGKVIKPSNVEIDDHVKFLKNSLPKNNFN